MLRRDLTTDLRRWKKEKSQNGGDRNETSNLNFTNNIAFII